MIPFIEKTWPFWWMFAAFVAVRWFHLLSVRGGIESSDAFFEEEEERACIRFLQKAQVSFLSGTDTHSGIPAQNATK